MEFKLTKLSKTFSFEPPIQIKADWMIGLPILEVYISILNITRENKIFEFYTDTFDELSFTELKDELEEFLDISNKISEHLQDVIIGPSIIPTYTKLETERRQIDGYYMI